MPWPWTINQAGDGAFYASEKELKNQADSLISAGKSNFDLGCFQVNYGWHGENFASLEAMMDPQTNADYAAAMLKRLYDAKGDWIKAAGAYHSGTDAEAKSYIAKVEAALGQPVTEPAIAAASEGGITQAAADWFLRDGTEATATLGSLVKLACSDCEGRP
ncbi:MAG: transglycosylase SLT domain-containing protein [Deltaproteobacteria bacterium]